MKDLVYKDHTALDYAKMACDTLMKKFDAPDLPPKGRFHYHQGVFLSGMQKTYDICQEEKYYDYIKAWVDSIIKEDGTIETFDKGQLDDIQPGVLLYELYRKSGDERYKKALFTLLTLIKNSRRTMKAVSGIRKNILTRCGLMAYTWQDLSVQNSLLPLTSRNILISALSRHF